MTVKIEVNDTQAQAKLAALQAAIADKSGLFKVIGRRMVDRVRLGFKLGIDPWGSPWAKVKWRAARTNAKGKLTRAGKDQAAANAAGAAGQPLVNTGAMRDSVTARVDGDGVTVGTNKIQARVHQFGATIVPVKAKALAFPGPNGPVLFAKKVTIPARPYLPLRRGAAAVQLPPAWAEDVTRAIKAHIVSRIKEAS